MKNIGDFCQLLVEITINDCKELIRCDKIKYLKENRKYISRKKFIKLIVKHNANKNYR